MTAEMQARNCAAQKKLSELYRKHGMPVRGEGDTHAAESDKSAIQEDGGEYFAIAIETLFFDQAEFCRAFSADEIAKLKESFGDCLAKFKRPMPPCWNGPANVSSAPTSSTKTGSFFQP